MINLNNRLITDSWFPLLKHKWHLIGFILLLSSSLSTYSFYNKKEIHTTEVERIYTFYNAMFDHLEKDYFMNADYDWAKLKEQTIKDALAKDTFDESIALTSEVFDSIKCNHCQIFFADAYYGSSLNKTLGQEDFSTEFLLEYQNNPSFRVSLVNEEYGYINMPGMLLIDIPIDELNNKAQAMYDAIAKLNDSKEIKGWIVDLRFNIGGNAYPMIASLYHLLGDRIVFNVKDREGNIRSRQWLENGAFISDNKVKTKIVPTISADVKTPVALIIGKLTASAGENIAIAFQQRANSVIVGEESYGHLTANSLVDLSEGAQFAITTGYIVDDKGYYRHTITPDISISKQDNFKDLTEDGNIKRAIKYFKSASVKKN